jgi:hypothetical protein
VVHSPFPEAPEYVTGARIAVDGGAESVS